MKSVDDRDALLSARVCASFALTDDRECAKAAFRLGLIHPFCDSRWSRRKMPANASTAWADEDAETERGREGCFCSPRAGRAGRHTQADVRPAIRFRQRQHVLRDLRRGAHGPTTGGRDRGLEEAGWAG